jgi:glycosyltransferase involved in cell wall biosynthesis
MARSIPVSVAIATYNGEKYICEQLDTILQQLDHPQDEIVVFDDASSDSTVQIIRSYNSPFIRLFIQPVNLGQIPTFEKAIDACLNPLIFLSDQDDIWLPHKVMSYYLSFRYNPDALLFYSDHQAFSGLDDVVIHSTLDYNFPFRFFIPLLNTRVHGPGIAFSAKAKSFLLPFPKKISSHDQWISLLLSISGPSVFIPFFCQKYRIHPEQVCSLDRTKRRSILCILFSRLYMLKSLVFRFFLNSVQFSFLK